MDHQDRQAIEQLFGKIAQVERQSTPPDAQAADFIRGQIADFGESGRLLRYVAVTCFRKFRTPECGRTLGAW